MVSSNVLYIENQHGRISILTFTALCHSDKNVILVRCLFDRANKICSPSTLEAEQKFFKNVLQQNGYPDPFIERNMGGKEPTTMMYTAERKPIYICSPFKSEVASERVNRRLFRAIRSTFASATLKSWFTTLALFSLNLKDKVPSPDQSMVVYSFSCCCAAEYIGRTTRRLSQRIREYHPAWLRTGGNKSITSSVVAHLANIITLWSPLEPSEWFIKHHWTNQSLLGNAYWQPLNRLPFDNASLFFVCKNSLSNPCASHGHKSRTLTSCKHRTQITIQWPNNFVPSNN